MRLVVVFTFISSLLLSVSGQNLSQWKNLKLDSTTPDEAISMFGKPKKDKIVKPRFNKEVSVETQSQMNFRKLEFKKSNEFKSVHLLFLNEMLSTIDLTPNKKKMLASDLENNFETNFLFMEGMPKTLKFADYEGQKETTIPKVYPINYFMLGIKSDMAIIATIDNSSWKSIWRDALSKPSSEMYPGYITNIKIFSRSRETK